MHGLRKDKKFQLLLQLIMQSGGLGHFTGAFFLAGIDFLWVKVTLTAPVSSVVLGSICFSSMRNLNLDGPESAQLPPFLT